MKKAFQHDRVENTKNEWLTPRWILERLGEFDTDPCAPVIRPWPTASRHFTIEDDGLKQEWPGRVWLNPPYDNKLCGRFMACLATHGNGIALIYARTDTRIWHRHVWPVASAILFLDHRITFCNVDGSPGKNTGGAPSALVAYGWQNAAALKLSKIPGALVDQVATIKIP